MKTTQISLIKPYMELTKIDLYAKVGIIKRQVEDGFLTGLDALIYAKKISEFAKELDKVVRPIAESEADIQKGGITIHSVAISQKESGVSYDYQACGDPVWNQLEKESETLKSAIKEREAFLKTIKGSVTLIDEDTSEISKVYAPIRSGKLGLTLTIQ